MSKLKVTFDTKTITVPNESCCADGVTCVVNISGAVPGHRYYCELVSLSGGSVTFAQNNFYIVAQSSEVVVPIGFGLKNTRSYVIKFKITDTDTRKSYRYWIPSKDEWHKAAYYDPTRPSLPSTIYLQGWGPDQANEDINGTYTKSISMPGGDLLLAAHIYKHVSKNAYVYYSLLNQKWCHSSDDQGWYNPSDKIEIPLTGWIIDNAIGTAGSVCSTCQISTGPNDGGYWRYAMMTDSTPETQICDSNGTGLASVGSLSLTSQGPVSAQGDNINTATNFSVSLPGIVSTSYKNGYFKDFPSNTYISNTWNISTASNSILEFTHPILGSFTASSISTTINTSFVSSSGDTSRRRVLYLKGTLIQGSLGELPPSGIPCILVIELLQFGSTISLSAILSLSPKSANYNGAAEWNSLDSNLTTVGTNGGPSYYGTYDQNGNINQWIDDITTKSKQYTGGFWDSSSYDFRRIVDSPIRLESANIGFRTAASLDKDLNVDPTKYLLVDQINTSTNIKDSNGLGAVSYPFYIQKYPVTNAEYVDFLNIVAKKSDDHGLYNSKMTTDIRGGIVRSIDEDKMFVYTCKDNMNNKPVNFINWFDAARYCNWLHNLSFDTEATNTETGAYDLTETNNNIIAPYSGFAYSEDIVTIQCGEVSGHSVVFSDDTIELSKSFGCNRPKSIVAFIKGAIIGRSYSYNFSSNDGLFANIFPISGTIIAGDTDQNINTVYSYSGSLKKVELKLEVTDLVNNITASDSIVLSCEDCSPTPK